MAATTRMRHSDASKREFAERLLNRLAEMDMTQADLARKIGYSKDAVSTWARHRSLPSQDALEAVAKQLRCSTEDLLPHRFSAPQAAAIDLKMLGNGRARVRIDTDLPSDVAIKIVQMAYEASD